MPVKQIKNSHEWGLTTYEYVLSQKEWDEMQNRIEKIEDKLLQFADLVIEELDVAALDDCETGVASLNKQAAKEYLAHFPYTFQAIHKIKDKAEEILNKIEEHDG